MRKLLLGPLAALCLTSPAFAWTHGNGGGGGAPTIVDTNLGVTNTNASSNMIGVTSAACTANTGTYFVAWVTFNDATALTGVTDQGSGGNNTYSITGPYIDTGGNGRGYLAIAQVTHTIPLISGSPYLTFTFGGTTSRGNAVYECITNLNTSGSPIDIGPTNVTGSSTTPSNGPTASFAHAPEIALGMLEYTNATDTVTEDTTNGTWVFKGVSRTTGTVNGAGRVASQVFSGTGPATYAPALSPSDVWADVIVTLKGQ